MSAPPPPRRPTGPPAPGPQLPPAGPGYRTETPTHPRRRTWVVLTVAGLAAVALLAVAVTLLLGRGRGGVDARPTPVPSASVTHTSRPTSSGSPTPTPTPTRTPTPSRSSEPPDPGAALAALATLAVAPPDAFDGYDRDLFGWRTYDHDRNGCDIRNDVLRRDLTDVVVRPGTNGCKVDTGTLADPYTGSIVEFVVGTGPTNDGGVQIDHVVALANAWETGAQDWEEDTFVRFGNDPLNLLAVASDANQSKSADDAAAWLPANAGFRCAFVARQIAVKAEYALWVTPEEHDAMADVLSTCPDERLPTAASAATPALVP